MSEIGRDLKKRAANPQKKVQESKSMRLFFFYGVIKVRSVFKI